MTLEFEARLRLGRFHYEARLSAADELVVLYGHSGAGKSVTLQLTAGLLKPDAGRIVIGGETVFDAARGVELPPQRRRIGYVVQDLALFPRMTAAENVGFGVTGSRQERARRVAEMLGLFGLQGFEDRLPGSLSGGQQQRVALGRALAREANLLLLDEPFSALDASLREGLRRELLRLRAELGLSILFVTHDLREAHLLADRLAVFDGGRVLQFGPREEVFRRPVSRRVAELTGVANVFPAVVLGRVGDGVMVEAEGLSLLCAQRQGGDGLSAGQTVDVAIRAERVILRRGEAGEVDGQNLLEAAVVAEYPFGSSHTLRFAAVGPGPRLEAELASRPYEVLGVAGRKRWVLELPPEDLWVMPAQRGEGSSAGTLRV